MTKIDLQAKATCEEFAQGKWLLQDDRGLWTHRHSPEEARDFQAKLVSKDVWVGHCADQLTREMRGYQEGNLEFAESLWTWTPPLAREAVRKLGPSGLTGILLSGKSAELGIHTLMGKTPFANVIVVSLTGFVVPQQPLFIDFTFDHEQGHHEDEKPLQELFQNEIEELKALGIRQLPRLRVLAATADPAEAARIRSQVLEEQDAIYVPMVGKLFTRLENALPNPEDADEFRFWYDQAFGALLRNPPTQAQHLFHLLLEVLRFGAEQRDSRVRELVLEPESVPLESFKEYASILETIEGLAAAEFVDEESVVGADGAIRNPQLLLKIAYFQELGIWDEVKSRSRFSDALEAANESGIWFFRTAIQAAARLHEKYEKL